MQLLGPNLAGMDGQRRWGPGRRQDPKTPVSKWPEGCPGEPRALDTVRAEMSSAVATESCREALSKHPGAAVAICSSTLWLCLHQWVLWDTGFHD